MEKFHEILNKTLKEQKISQKELADNTGITRATISRYIAGQILPNSESLVKISDYLGVSTDYLLGKISQLKYEEDNDLQIIQRARQNMSKEDKKKMMDLLNIAFDKAFKE